MACSRNSININSLSPPFSARSLYVTAEDKTVGDGFFLDLVKPLGSFYPNNYTAQRLTESESSFYVLINLFHIKYVWGDKSKC